jgi:sugar phosphate isomerase/epimerase
MNRKDFLRSAALLSTGMIIAPTIACTAEKYIGLQIYSVRDAISKDLEGSLAAIAEMGYNSIEHAGYGKGKFYGLAPEAFRDLIESLGMKLLSGHCGLNPEGKKEDWKQAIADHGAAGIKYLVIPSIGGMHRNSLDQLKKTADAFNEMGQICKAEGLKFAYHNHAFEFEALEGRPMYDQLLELTDPDLVSMEMDLYWTYRGQQDPLDYFEKYPGRFELWHVKDMEEGPEQFFAEVGHGIINFEMLFAQQKQAGLVYYFVEQDRSRRDPMESVRMIAVHLKSVNYL